MNAKSVSLESLHFDDRSHFIILGFHFHIHYALMLDQNPNPYWYQESYPDFDPIPNPSPDQKIRLFSKLAKHWWRDHLKSSFLPITPEGCFYAQRHAGGNHSKVVSLWTAISVEKYAQPCLITCEIPKYTDFWWFRGEWYSILDFWFSKNQSLME